MRPPLRELDRPLTAVVVALAAYGLATLYSAGQTDLTTFVTTIWQKQLIWLGVGAVAAILMFRTSPRLLEWATPYAYAIGVLVLVFTLFAGTGGGRRRASARGSPSADCAWGNPRSSPSSRWC